MKAGATEGLAVLLLLVGCFDVRSRDPGIELLPDDLGRVTPASNELGISGYWYAYGDQYDCPSRCTEIGMHDPTECSYVYTPAHLPTLGFTNTSGRMCTTGKAARVLGCVPGVEFCGDDMQNLDYSNMWGAGIGLDFGLAVAPGDDPGAFVRRPLERIPWDAKIHHITGISFDLNWFGVGGDGAPHLRVEFPFVLPDKTTLPKGKGTVGFADCHSVIPPLMPFPDQPPPTEEHPSGSPFWGSGPTWGDDSVSPVKEGYNEIRLDSLKAPPDAGYMVDLTKLLGIQFHVPTGKGPALEYGFCISNLVLLRD